MTKLSRQIARLERERASKQTENERPLSQESDASRTRRVEEMRSMMGAMARRYDDGGEARRTRTPEVELPGRTVETTFGPGHVIDEVYSETHCHGRYPVGGGAMADASTVGLISLDKGLLDVDFAGALYLDTETTGLAGGTGTIPFLVGMSWFEGPQLRVQQLFVKGFGQERPMLQLLGDRLREATCVVTYNGKSFDWPLLRSRFIMNRLEPPEPPPHLDLLHCARRLFKARLPHVRLTEVERSVLGYVRVDDVDGAEIPDIYMDYVAADEVEPMLDVLRHNRDDLLALPALLGVMTGLMQGTLEVEHPSDRVACAEVAERSGDVARAELLAREAVETWAGDIHVGRAWSLLARLARKQKDFAQEEHCLLAALETTPSNEVHHVHFRLAILYEHQLGDPSLSLLHARQGKWVEDVSAQRRRVARLEKKILINAERLKS